MGAKPRTADNLVTPPPRHACNKPAGGTLFAGRLTPACYGIILPTAVCAGVGDLGAVYILNPLRFWKRRQMSKVLWNTQ